MSHFSGHHSKSVPRSHPPLLPPSFSSVTSPQTPILSLIPLSATTIMTPGSTTWIAPRPAHATTSPTTPVSIFLLPLFWIVWFVVVICTDTHPDTSDDSTTNSDGSSEVGSVFQALSLTLPSLCRDTSVEACYLAQPMQSVSPPQYAERIEVESSGEHSTQRAGGRTPDLFAVRNASAKSKVVSNYSRQMSVDESSRSPRNWGSVEEL